MFAVREQRMPLRPDQSTDTKLPDRKATLWVNMPGLGARLGATRALAPAALGPNSGCLAERALHLNHFLSPLTSLYCFSKDHWRRTAFHQLSKSQQLAQDAHRTHLTTRTGKVNDWYGSTAAAQYTAGSSALRLLTTAAGYGPHSKMATEERIKKAIWKRADYIVTNLDTVTLKACRCVSLIDLCLRPGGAACGLVWPEWSGLNIPYCLISILIILCTADASWRPILACQRMHSSPLRRSSPC